MKNYLILAMLLIAGLTAYPQATRTERDNKNEKGSNKREAVRSNRSESGSAARRSESARTRVETKSSDRPQATRSNNESSRTRVESRSAERPQSTRNQESSRARVETKSTDRPQAARSNNESSRTRVESKSADRPQATRSNNEPSRTRVETRSAERPQATRSTDGATRKSQEPAVNRSDNRSAGEATPSRNIRESGNPNDRDIKVTSSSASRTYREGKGTLTRDDGTVIRHQNDEVFSSRKYKLDFDNYQNLRKSNEFRNHYRDYDNWYHHRHVRVVNHYYNRYIPVPWDIRRVRYYHRMPHHIDLIWTPLLFHRFMYYYPTHTNWEMEFGSQIETISAYESEMYAGTVRRVYGKVDQVYYSPEDETYILYIGAPFPYQDISVVIPKHIARNLSMSPKWYFEDEYVWVVGLINMWEGKPEIIIRDEDQIRRY